MLNRLFSGMLLLGIIVGACTGHIGEVSLAFLDSAKEAVTLCITMLGVVGLWTGIMKVAEDAGLSEKLAHLMRPVVSFLFPRLKGKESAAARAYLSENLAANLLGLGWAATPTGLKAMQELNQLRERQQMEHHSPSDEMCMFLLVNVSSLQLIPVKIIAFRSQYGAVDPSAIILPAILATTVSTAVAVCYGKWKMRR